MGPFTKALRVARRALDDAGYPDALIVVTLSHEMLLAVQHEVDVAEAIVEYKVRGGPSRAPDGLLAVERVAVMDGVDLHVPIGHLVSA